MHTRQREQAFGAWVMVTKDPSSQYLSSLLTLGNTRAVEDVEEKGGPPLIAKGFEFYSTIGTEL